MKCVPALAFLVSAGVNQDTVSVGPPREPYPVFKDFNSTCLKDIHSFIHSFFHSCTQHAVMHVHYVPGCGLVLETVTNKTEQLSAFMEL